MTAQLIYIDPKSGKELSVEQVEKLTPVDRAKAREAGIRSRARKEGLTEGARREHERLTAIHEAALHSTHTAHAKELERQAHAHRAAGFWRGAAIGGVVIGATAMAGAAVYTNAILGPTFEAASQARMQDTVVQTLDRQVNPPEPVYPGPEAGE